MTVVQYQVRIVFQTIFTINYVTVNQIIITRLKLKKIIKNA